jgi:hypothetical protein
MIINRTNDDLWLHFGHFYATLEYSCTWLHRPSTQTLSIRLGRLCIPNAGSRRFQLYACHCTPGHVDCPWQGTLPSAPHELHIYP